MFEAKIDDGSNPVIEIRTWGYKGAYDLTKSYRNAQHNGANGGYAIELDTEPLQFSAPVLIDDGDYAALKALENTEVTLSVKDNSGVYTVKILNVIPGKMIDPTVISTANFVTSTATFRMVTINFLRET